MTALALASKETAVAIPLLCALLALRNAGTRRRQLALVCVSAVVVAVYSVWRLAQGIPASHTSLPSGYAAKELLSRPFAALALPLHRSVPALPVLSAALALLWPTGLAMAAAAWRMRPAGYRRIVIGAGWAMASVLPVFTMFFVGDDLQGSRYSYLASTMWAISVVSVVGDAVPNGNARAAEALALAVVIAFAVLLRFNLRPWEAASETRDQVLRAYAALECRPQDVTGLPDAVEGAYVFRNGFAEAVVGLGGNRQAASCSVRWTGDTFELLPPSEVGR